MPRLEQYPHYLFLMIPGSSHQDENGNWVRTETETVYLGRCREETDGKGSEVQIAGGAFRRYTSLIQLPKGTKHIDDGSNVIVSNDQSGSDVRIEGTSLKCDVGQLHTRLWL